MKYALIMVACISAALVAAAPASADDRHDGYQRYKGYKERPYDRGRRYDYHRHYDHRYHYRGHWRSWDEWDRYTRKYPRVRKYGRYYYDGPHLMFRTCPPESNTCIFFSIGR